MTGGYVEGTDTVPGKGKIEKLKRTNSAMTKLGFTVLLNPGARNYMDAVKNDYVGWKVLAHNPLNFAEVSGKGFSVNSAAETFISIRSQVICNVNLKKIKNFLKSLYKNLSDQAVIPNR